MHSGKIASWSVYFELYKILPKQVVKYKPNNATWVAMAEIRE